MSEFTLCEECAREYHTPENRRFHAQPNACPRCGPQVRLHGSAGDDLARENPIGDAIQVLREGQILALRGIGGFHLVVDATNDTIFRARLATTQTNTVTWELSADGGSAWDPFPADDVWHQFSSPGTDLLWRSTHSYVTPGVNPASRARSTAVTWRWY